jgi:hypothetical protein
VLAAGGWEGRISRDGAEAFDESWRSLLASIEGKM